MTETIETIPFQAETEELLELVIHSLYTNPSIFLRELISNASDALDKLRFEALTRPELTEGKEEPAIRLATDPEARILCVIDNGIGMSREEVVQNIGTIARSGTKKFIEALKGNQEGTPELIGQFGVGFYSSFMVADEVVVETRRAGEEKGTRWTSTGRGEYTLEEIDKPAHGTTIMLHLKPLDEKREGGDQVPDFTQQWTVRETVKRYSDFIEYPIEMEVGEGDEAKVEVLNSRKPIWTRLRQDIEESEYNEFYKHLTHDWNDPLRTIHFKAEGTTEYTALLYLPSKRPLDLFDPNQAKSKIHLYVKRVFIMADCEELVPVWLRFVRGVVDSSDLPLNISRETLQHNRQMDRIQKRLTKKTLDTLGEMRDKDREAYNGFWDAFGGVLKEGLYYESEYKDQLSELALFETSAGKERCTLPEYVERMPVKQKEIYVLLAPDRAAAERSPHLEALRAEGYEVLFLVDAVDEFVLQRFEEYGGKKLRQIDRGEVDLGGEDTPEREEREKALEPLLEAVRKELADEVEEVRFSKRLTESPACLVEGENSMPPQMLRFLKETGQPVPEQKRSLELNATHSLVQRLEALRGDEAQFARFSDYCHLLFGQALLAEGSPLSDPARFSKLLTELMVEGE